MNIKQEKGITLTALVVTIIVLSIIAGIGINYGRDTIEKAHLEELETNKLSLHSCPNKQRTKRAVLALVSSQIQTPS